MKLYDYLSLMPEGNELTVWDKDYDIEIYFYSDKPDDRWGKSMWKLTEILDIVQINENGVIVNLADVIKRNIDKFSELFESSDIDDIMEDTPNIFTGNVSEDWMEKFADIMTV